MNSENKSGRQWFETLPIWSIFLFWFFGGVGQAGLIADPKFWAIGVVSLPAVVSMILAAKKFLAKEE